MKKTDKKILKKFINKFHSTEKPFKMASLSDLLPNNYLDGCKDVRWVEIIVAFRSHVEMYGYDLRYHDENDNVIRIWRPFDTTYWVMHKGGLNTKEVVEQDIPWLK